MVSLTQDQKHTIERLVKNFTANLLGNRNPKEMCFNVCYPLSIHLSNHRIRNSIESGWFKSRSNPHYWLALGDIENTIIDPTIRQFDESLPSVFIGSKTDSYEDHPKVFFNDIYDAWQEPFLNFGCVQHPALGSIIKSDIKAQLNLHIRAATILNNEIAIRNKMKTREELALEEKYFEVIYKAVLKYFEHRESLVDPLLYADYQNLFLKAKTQINLATTNKPVN